MYNRIILIGRLTKDPELTLTPQQIPYTRFSLAVNRGFGNKDGNEEVDFFNCIAWRSTAETIAKYLKKGSLTQVDGKVQIRKYTTESGESRTSFDVVVNSAVFLESKKQQDEAMNDDSEISSNMANVTDDDLNF